MTPDKVAAHIPVHRKNVTDGVIVFCVHPISESTT